MQQTFGYDPSVTWKIASIKPSLAAGMSEVVVIVGNSQGQQVTTFYVTGDGKHEDTALQIDDCIMEIAFNALVPTPTRKFCRVVGRPQQSPCRTVRVAIRHLEVIDDLALVPNVIAGSEHVDAEVEEFFGDLTGDAEAGRGVLSVGDDQINRMSSNQRSQFFLNDIPPGPPKNVPNKQYAQAVPRWITFEDITREMGARLGERVSSRTARS